MYELLNHDGHKSGFDSVGSRFFWKPQRKEKQFVFYVADKFLAANPEISFPEFIDMAICSMFRENPECKKLWDADIVRHQPNFFSANTATLEQCKAFFEKLETTK